MRFLFLLLTILLWAGGPALAQVTVNLDALKALPPTGTASGHGNRTVPRANAPARSGPARPELARALPVPPIPPPEGPSVGTASVAAPAAPTPPAAPPKVAAKNPPPGTSSAALPRARTMPVAPPPAAVLSATPPPQVALAPAAPSPPAAIAAPPPPAPGATTQVPANETGMTVTFGAEATDLSSASAAAVKELAQSVPANDAVSFNVLAYAHGQASDPSTARRLSLARALAIRGALIAAGVPSTRIYVRALGSEAGAGPADRADISVMGANAPAATAAAAPHTTPGGKQE